MAIPRETKQEFVRRLRVTRDTGVDLEISLKFKGEFEEADKVAAATAALTRQIDKLLGQIIDEWLAQGLDIVAEITGVNASLEKSIDKINKDVETAQNVVKAIGFIDDAVAIAAKVAATISKAL
jgi:hypothetical protein